MSETIAYIPGEIDIEAMRALESACSSTGHALSEDMGNSPLAIVAGLPVGQRSVPVEVAEHLAEASAATPLVLLAKEPLVRDHVVLAAGRVHLLAPPHEPERMLARLQHVLDGRGPTIAEASPYRSSYSRIVERWGVDFWACVLSAAPKPGPDEIGKLLLLEKRVDGCFAIFPTESTRRQPAELVDLFERLLLGDDRSLCQWLADLSGKGALVAYDSESRELVADVPAADECAVFLLSPHRLPTVSALPAGRATCIAAAPGDILLAAVGTGAVGLLDADTVRSVVRAGAVVGARELQQRFTEMESSNAILLLEARA